MIFRDAKIRGITKLYSTLFIYLLYEYSKRFLQPVVQPAAKYKRALTNKVEGTCTGRVGGFGPPSNTGFTGSTQVPIPNNTSIGSDVFVGSQL